MNHILIKDQENHKIPYIFARGSRHCKNKGLGHVFEAEIMQISEFMKFHQFSTFSGIIGFSEKVDFLDFQRPVRIFTHFRA